MVCRSLPERSKKAHAIHRGNWTLLVPLNPKRPVLSWVTWNKTQGFGVHQSQKEDSDYLSGGFLKSGYPRIIHFNRIVHYKSSILGYPDFRKDPQIFEIPDSQQVQDLGTLGHPKNDGFPMELVVGARVYGILGGTPKWMVYNGQFYQNGGFEGKIPLKWMVCKGKSHENGWFISWKILLNNGWFGDTLMTYETSIWRWNLEDSHVEMDED